MGTDPSTPNKAPKFHDSSCPIPVTHPSLCHKSRLRREPPIAHMCACAPLLLNPANDTQLPLSVPTISPCTPQPITAAHTQLHCTHTTGGLARIRLEWNEKHYCHLLYLTAPPLPWSCNDTPSNRSTLACDTVHLFYGSPSLSTSPSDSLMESPAVPPPSHPKSFDNSVTHTRPVFLFSVAVVSVLVVQYGSPYELP